MLKNQIVQIEIKFEDGTLYSPYGEFYCFAVIFGIQPSDICFTSFMANRISLSPTDLISLSQSENITLPMAAYHLIDKKEREDS